jgi:hypothetical protein
MVPGLTPIENGAVGDEAVRNGAVGYRAIVGQSMDVVYDPIES